MSKKDKSIIEEALLDIQMLQESLKNNTEDIFRSVMKEEIDGIVESALMEDDYEEEDIDLGDDSGEDVESADEFGADVEDTDVDADNEESDVDAMVPPMGDDEPLGDEAGLDNDMDFGGSDELDLTSASDDEVIKAYKKLSDTDEIEIVGNEITIKDSDSGNEYVIKTGGGAPSAEPEMDADFDVADEAGLEDADDMGETMYEITLSEEIIKDEDLAKGKAHADYPTDASTPNEIEDATAPIDSDSGDNLDGGFVEDEATSGDAHAEHVMETEGGTTGKAYGPIVKGNTAPKAVDGVNPSTAKPAEEVSENEEVMEGEETLEEAIPEGTAESRRQPGRNTSIKGPGAKENTPAAVKENVQAYREAIKGYTSLKNENKQIKEAFTQLREHLKGALLYNQNLTHIVKLFTEGTTTKKEKAEIVKKFDNVSTIEESKSLFENYSNDLKGKSVMVESRIETKTKGSGSSSKLVEKTAFNRENSRIMDLMERVEGKKLI